MYSDSFRLDSLMDIFFYILHSNWWNLYITYFIRCSCKVLDTFYVYQRKKKRQGFNEKSSQKAHAFYFVILTFLEEKKIDNYFWFFFHSFSFSRSFSTIKWILKSKIIQNLLKSRQMYISYKITYKNCKICNNFLILCF